MDKASTLWKSYQERFASLPFVRSTKFVTGPGERDGRDDARLSFKTPDGRSHSFIVELKQTSLHGSAASELAARIHNSASKQSASWLVLAPYIDPIAGKALSEAGIHYLDLHGNCRVALNDKYLVHIEKAGAPAKPTMLKGWRPASFRALFALLAEPTSVSLTTRELAQRAGGVSPQTAADVRTKLRERGLLLEARGESRWAPAGYQQALELWVHGFTTTLRPALHIGRFRAKERDPIRLEVELTPLLDQFGPWAWGGGAACQRLTNFYRGDTTVVYLREPPAPSSHLRGLVPDARGPVSVLVSPGPQAFTTRVPYVVHPVLAYADLLAESEPRAAEAAAELHERFIVELSAQAT